MNPHFTQAALAGLKTTYAQVNSTGHIIEHDSLFSKWLLSEESNLAGMALLDALPEFFGQETEIEDVRQGKQPFFRLENINRSATTTGKPRYLTLTVISDQSDSDTALTVLLTDVTEQGQYLQELTQNRNELRMAQRRLADLSYRLDYILRHYLSPNVADALLKGELQLELGGELREVSILFADVRDFTPLSEKLSPGQVVQLLNEYLGVVSRAIEDFDGAITQFQGDNVIAIFNMTCDQPAHALYAAKAGAALQQAVMAYQAQRPPKEPCLYFGVGINTGTALIGNIGAYKRYSYTATGDAVNLAARITGAVPATQIWIGRSTYDQLDDTIAVESLPPMVFKGKSQSTQLYRVLY